MTFATLPWQAMGTVVRRPWRLRFCLLPAQPIGSLESRKGIPVTDFDEEEIARKITISTAIAAAEWNKKKINLLDTPGYNMFITDTKSAIDLRRHSRR